MKKFEAYQTNAICPHCSHFLYTSDIKGYPLLCKNCNENMYMFENASITRDNPNPKFSIKMPMERKTFERIKDIAKALVPLAKITYKHRVCCFDWEKSPEYDVTSNVRKIGEIAERYSA